MPSRARVATDKTARLDTTRPGIVSGLAGSRAACRDPTADWTTPGPAANDPVIQQRAQHRAAAFGVIATTMKLANIKLIVGAMACALAVACVTRSPFTEGGIPSSKYLVGGGLEMQFLAPTVGTAIVVEETTAKILATRSLDEGDLYDFAIELTPEDFLNKLGIAMSDARIGPYFVPRKTAD